jgi:ribosomal protein L40E
MRRSVAVVAVLVALAGCARAAEIRIGDILDDPARFHKERVTVWGLVTDTRVVEPPPDVPDTERFTGEFDLTSRARTIVVKTMKERLPPKGDRGNWTAVVNASVTPPVLEQRGIVMIWPLIAALAVLVVLAVLLIYLLVRPRGIICPHPDCGARNREGAEVCRKCHRPLRVPPPPSLGESGERVKLCEKCRAPNALEAAFCDQCREPFVTTEIAKKVADLVVLEGKGARFPVLEKEVQRIGRGRDMDIRLDDDTVSNEHAEILWQDGSLFIEDRHSTNGTFVNGQKVVRQLLKDKDVVQLGRTRLLLIMAAPQGA